MAELKATVCLQGKDIEVISSHIEFNRKTDNKGRPVTNVIGGRITITVESTRETTILEAMVNSPFKAISGKVIYYNTKDNSIFRVVEFKYAYIVYYKEVYNVDRKRQMYSTITFSADIIMIGDAYFKQSMVRLTIPASLYWIFQRRNMKFSCLDIIVLRNITNFVHCGCGDNGFAASFTISIFNVLIATFLFFNGVKIELC